MRNLSTTNCSIMFFVFLYTLCSTVLAIASTEGENLTAVGCAEDSDCSTGIECREMCGCDRPYTFNETLKICVLNLGYLDKGMLEKSNAQDISDVQNEDYFANKLEREAEQAFQGILISVMLFGACASICILSACFYCCRINYKDAKLRKEVEALAEKLNRDGKSIKAKKIPIKPVAESCNIMVEDAGVFVV